LKFKLDTLASKNGWNFDSICEQCGNNLSECDCKPTDILPANKHKLHFRLEKRNGKPVTVILPFALSNEDIKKTLATLKKKLACGGAIKNSEIEIQGDVKERAKAILQNEGFGFK
jgi:translation initiation factor 1